MELSKKKPVTMITGYLGSGKTTVLNELLKSQTNKNLAIIVNDLGSINIDASLIKNNSVVESYSKMIEMTNGITSFVFKDPRPFDYDRFIEFVSNDFPPEIIRGKGYMWFKNDGVHVQLFEQAGRNSTVTEVSNWVASMSEEDKQLIFEEYPDIKAEWHEKYGDRLNQLVFIGRGYDKELFVKKAYGVSCGIK